VEDAGSEVAGLLSELARWMGDERVESAARSRARERWLRQQQVEEARFSGIALDLAERGTPVLIRTTAGSHYNGVIVAVGGDFLAIRSKAPQVSLLLMSAVATIRPQKADRPPTGDRPSPMSVSMADTLVVMSADHPRVRLVIGPGDAVSGELVAAGMDVVTVRLDASPPLDVYVQLATVLECTVL
jgi:hypothetical protein